MLAAVAEAVLAAPVRRPAGRRLVGVDGVDGSGKTTFADELAEALRGRGMPVLRVLADDFLAPAAVRHRQGRDSPRGFYEDSYDLARFVGEVLAPLGAGGAGRISRRALDLAADEVLAPVWEDVPTGAVVLVDGMFLHRPPVAEHWDLSVFLEVPFAVTAARMAVRDGTPADPDAPDMRRYVEGQRLYLAEWDPARRATYLIDNADPDAPRVLSP